MTSDQPGARRLTLPVEVWVPNQEDEPAELEAARVELVETLRAWLPRGSVVQVGAWTEQGEGEREGERDELDALTAEVDAELAGPPSGAGAGSDEAVGERREWRLRGRVRGQPYALVVPDERRHQVLGVLRRARAYELNWEDAAVEVRDVSVQVGPWVAVEPCAFTHAHTRAWCGNPGCREA